MWSRSRLYGFLPQQATTFTAKELLEVAIVFMVKATDIFVPGVMAAQLFLAGMSAGEIKGEG